MPRAPGRAALLRAVQGRGGRARRRRGDVARRSAPARRGMSAPVTTPALPLAGLRVLDFSNLLPGPLASLLLAEAGAEVIKVERAPGGDEMRGYPPAWDGAGANFALLNRGKTSLAADLKDDGDRAHVRELARSADVLIEQFRPGVMARLGLGDDQLRADNPGLVYCSITGWGQTGARAHQAGHDLNYLAETGLLGLARASDGAPGRRERSRLPKRLRPTPAAAGTSSPGA